MLSLICLFATLAAASALSPTSWSGSFRDNVFGGSLNVCVSLDASTNTYYAQGIFSLLGYIRGTIDQSTFVWSGEYCLSGEESRSGNFSFALSEQNDGTLAYSGQFLERPGIPYMMYGNQTSNVTVSGLDCFQADTALLASQASTPYSFTGEWYVVDDNFTPLSDPAARWIYQSASDSTSRSYTQSYLYGAEGAYQGYAVGSMCMNGQVAMANWYENGNLVGLYLFVAKNATFFMSSWLDTATVSNFQFASTVSPSYYGASYSIKNTTATVPTLDEANVFSCYQLVDAADEDVCYAAVYPDPTVAPTAAPTSAAASAASNSYTGKMLKAILICSVFILIVVLLFFGHSVLSSFSNEKSTGRLLASSVVNSSSSEGVEDKAGMNDL